MIVVEKFHKYCEDEFNLSELDSVKLKYILEVLFGDLTKLILLTLGFALLGSGKDFIYSSLTLFVIRIFTGGLHFKSYGGCLAFSGLFFYTSIFLKNHISLNNAIVVAVFLVSVFIILILAPICEKSRPKYSSRKRLQFKLLGMFFIILHILGYIFTENNPYFINSIWVIALQVVQILIAKGGIIYEDHMFSYKKTT